MMLPQRKKREFVLQLLYSLDVNSGQDCSEIKSLFEEWKIDEDSFRELSKRISTIVSLLDILDEKIAQVVRSYEVKRISRVEHAILRLSLFELLYDETIPPKVTLSEAVRLGRKFGTKGGATFINGVLDAVYQLQERGDAPSFCRE